MEQLQTEIARRREIEVAAYYLWQRRGYPAGSPEVDWFQAEEQVRRETGDASSEPAMISVAKAVGAALGSVAGLVVSAASLAPSGESSESK